MARYFQKPRWPFLNSLVLIDDFDSLLSQGGCFDFLLLPLMDGACRAHMSIGFNCTKNESANRCAFRVSDLFLTALISLQSFFVRSISMIQIRKPHFRRPWSSRFIINRRSNFLKRKMKGIRFKFKQPRVRLCDQLSEKLISSPLFRGNHVKLGIKMSKDFYSYAVGLNSVEDFKTVPSACSLFWFKMIKLCK